MWFLNYSSRGPHSTCGDKLVLMMSYTLYHLWYGVHMNSYVHTFSNGGT